MGSTRIYLVFDLQVGSTPSMTEGSISILLCHSKITCLGLLWPCRWRLVGSWHSLALCPVFPHLTHSQFQSNIGEEDEDVHTILLACARCRFSWWCWGIGVYRGFFLALFYDPLGPPYHVPSSSDLDSFAYFLFLWVSGILQSPSLRLEMMEFWVIKVEYVFLRTGVKIKDSLEGASK